MKQAAVLALTALVTLGISGCLDPNLRDGMLAEYESCRHLVASTINIARVPCQPAGVQATVLAAVPAEYYCSGSIAIGEAVLEVYEHVGGSPVVLRHAVTGEHDVMAGFLLDVLDDGGFEISSWSAAGRTSAVVLRIDHLPSGPVGGVRDYGVGLLTAEYLTDTPALAAAEPSIWWSEAEFEGSTFFDPVHELRDADATHYFVAGENRTFQGGDFSLRITMNSVTSGIATGPFAGVDVGCGA